MGPAGITAQNIGRAVLKFFIVAGGGTILGKIYSCIFMINLFRYNIWFYWCLYNKVYDSCENN